MDFCSRRGNIASALNIMNTPLSNTPKCFHF